MTKSNEETARKKYLELQLLQQKMQQVQQQMEELDQQTLQIAGTGESLEEFKDVKEGTEILVPVANGIFARAKVTDTQQLLVNVGASINVQKSVPDVKRLMASQVKELKQLQEDLAKQLQQMADMAEKAQSELQELVKE